MGRSRKLDMTEGPVFKKLLLFAIPLMINTAINQLYSTADTIMMGRFAGAEAMAAVGASGHPLKLIINLVTGLAIGVTVACGNYKGKQDPQALSECMHTGISLGALAGLLITLLGVPLCGTLLNSLGTPLEILNDATLYMQIRLAFGVPMLLASFAANIFYASGDTQTATVVSVFSGLINVGLNVVFVPFLGMGVAGVALATGISQVINATVLCVLLFRPKGQYRLSLKRLKIRWKYVRHILITGVPAGLSNAIVSFSNVIMQSSVNSFGYLVVAGNTAADNLISYIILMVQAFRSACITAAAQCFGANNLARIRKTVRSAIPGLLGVVFLANVLITLFSTPLLGLFNDDPAVIAAGFPKLMFNCWGYLIFSLSKVFGGTLAGLHKSSHALICDLFCVIVPRLVWVWFVVPYMHTPTILYAIYPISWLLVSAATGMILYRELRKLETQSQVLAESP